MTMELSEIGLLDDGDIDLVEAGIALALVDRPKADQRLGDCFAT
jgi:hypothetical protein